MGSGITFSGFNDVDFNVILNAIMLQESQPLRALEAQQTALKSRVTTLNLLNNRVSALQSAATALTGAGALAAVQATSSDATAIGVSAGSGAVPGRYDIVVNQLARAQVTASTTSVADLDTTIVADSGTLTIGGQTISIDGPVTLAQLAETINAAADAPARAAVVQSAPGSYRLVLTGKNTGADNVFTVGGSLSGGTGISFGGNAVEAADADLLVNNIPIISASNTLDSVLPGATVTLYRQDPSATVVVDIASDPSALKSRLEEFAKAYNDLVTFANEQSTSAGQGDQSSIGRDPVLRQLRGTMRSVLTAHYPNSGAFQHLAEIGLELQQNGTLKVDARKLQDAVAGGLDNIQALVSGTGGVLTAVDAQLAEYTRSSGLLNDARKQLNDRATRLGDQIANMQDRLAIRRMSLQREFIAADEAMSALRSQSGSLASFGSIF